MKKRLYMMSALLLTIAAGFVSCSDDDETTVNSLSIAAFYPTIVMDGTEVAITGTGLSQVKDVMFPGGQTAKSVTIVDNNRIVAVAPANVAETPDALIISTGSEEANSRQTIRRAVPAIKYFNPSETIKTYEDLQIEGNDFMLVKSVEFSAGDDVVSVDAIDFKRKSNSSIIVTIPSDAPINDQVEVTAVFDNGEQLTLGNITVEKGAQPGGHWEEQEIALYDGGDVEMGGWSGYINSMPASLFETAQIGDRIRVYIKDAVEGWQQGSFKNGSTWGGLTDELGVIGLTEDDFNVGYYEMTIDETTMPILQETGLIISGCNYTATKVVLITTVWVSTNGDTTQEITLYDDGDVEMGGWSGYINNIPASVFESAKVGDIIRVYIKDPVEGWQQGSFKDGSTWGGLTDDLGVIGLSEDDFSAGYYQMIIDEVTLPILQSNGLIISGCNYTATKVVLIVM